MTRSQTMAAALLGMWLGWTLFMFFVAGVSFSTAERILRNPNPPFSHATQALSTEGTRSLFRYFAAELNRRVFAAYGWGEIVLGTVLLWILNRQNPRAAFDCGDSRPHRYAANRRARPHARLYSEKPASPWFRAIPLAPSVLRHPRNDQICSGDGSARPLASDALARCSVHLSTRDCHHPLPRLQRGWELSWFPSFGRRWSGGGC